MRQTIHHQYDLSQYRSQITVTEPKRYLWLQTDTKRWWGGSGISWTICKIANHLHLRYLCQHLIIQFFYRPDALPDAQPTVSKHWRQHGYKQYNTILARTLTVNRYDPIWGADIIRTDMNRTISCGISLQWRSEATSVAVMYLASCEEQIWTGCIVQNRYTNRHELDPILWHFFTMEIRSHICSCDVPSKLWTQNIEICGHNNSTA